MNTNKLKTFAKEARLKLIESIKSKIVFWGFDPDGNLTDEIEAIPGGYIFKGEVHNDESIPEKWKKLKAKIKDKQSVKDVIEEAAYTWFNRLMAIKILEKSGYDPYLLDYENGSGSPVILQQAKRGMYQPQKKSEKDLLKSYLTDNNDEAAFALLLIDYCHTHKLLNSVFGKINDYTELLIPFNMLSSNGIIHWINESNLFEDTDYKEVELIGWLYQFYISDRKDEVFAGFKQNKKARAEDIPAATQIFTPKWIVKYMVENDCNL